MNFINRQSPLFEAGKWLFVAAAVGLAGMYYIGTQQQPKYVYYFLSGTVYIEEHRTEGGGKVYSHDPSGTKQEFDVARCYNGLRPVLPALYLEIPAGEDPFHWEPPKGEARLALKEYLTNDIPAKVIFGVCGVDGSPKSGETAAQARARAVDEVALRYCSYEQQSLGYRPLENVRPALQ